MRRAIYPGSFDPVTNGHLDVIQRASRLFDDLADAVALKDQKHKSNVISIEERIELLRRSCDDIPNARIVTLDGLLVDFAKHQNVDAIVRDLRAISVFEFEFQMAL